MDFFNSKTPNPSSTNPYDGLETPFVQAMNERYAINAPPSLLTTRLTPALPLQTPMVPSSGFGLSSARAGVPRLPPLPQGAVLGPSVTTTFIVKPGGNAAPMSSSVFTHLLPQELVSMIPSKDILLIDIRTYALFQVSRLPGSISLVIPTTLLRRPNYSLEKMADMINDSNSRNQFNKWKSVRRIVAYDVDTTFNSDASNISGLLRKFQASGFQGDLNWLKGGFNAFEALHTASIDNTELSPQREETEESTDSVLRTRNLSTHAFMQSSTTLLGQMTPRGNDHPRTSTSSVAANPFYDNIRQNVELSQGVDSKIPLVLPPQVLARRNDLPFKWLRDIVDQIRTDPESEGLAMQFYRIELGEQRRLQSIMSHHTQESGSTPAPGRHTASREFPYSITAGIEMGTKNRYRNIWPFEHARVRLQTPSDKSGSDYINASFVQSIVSSRRYIATQGPLDSTFDDFWSTCWDQSVSVIVMLTREIESSQRKCGNYWKDGRYGSFDLKLIKQNGADEVHKPEQVGGFYHFPKATEKAPSGIIERVFQLSNRMQPRAPPRLITHLQYLEWSDMDVPDSPAGLLKLIHRVNAAELEGTSTMPKRTPGPILLHCSAGVGRTGGFILVESLLAGIRREMQKTHFPAGSMEMDVDEPESVTSQKLDLQPDYSSSRSSILTPSSNSGSESALKSSGPSSLRNASSVWSAEAVEGSSRGTPLSRLVGSKPKKLSHLVVDKLAKESKGSTMSQVAQWSKALPSAHSGTSSPYFGDLPSSSDESGFKEGRSNYKTPRKYNPMAGSPPPPSTLSEPIREVLEDMREQRMSLCQSLRQYIFVHRAIIEGALDLVDEASMERASSMGMRSPGTVASSVSPPNETAWSSTSSISSIGNTPSSPPTRAMAGRLSSSEGLTSRSSSSPPPHPKQSTGKRSASSAEGKIAKSFTKKKKHKSGDARVGDIASPLPPTSSARPNESAFRGRW